MLFALGEGEVSRDVKLAHEAAVGAALGYVEREAAFGRRRGQGGMVPVRGEGFVAAAFQHRTSRAGDPLLHHHVLVANLVRDGQGRWGALDGRLIYTHAKTAGYLYQAELRAQLSRRLGVRLTPVVRGTAEVTGIPAEVNRAFSRRRSQILTRMAERGESSARAAQVATLDTRRAKDHEVHPEGLLPEWRVRAARPGTDRGEDRRYRGEWRRIPTTTDGQGRGHGCGCARRTDRAHCTLEHVHPTRCCPRPVRAARARRRRRRGRTCRGRLSRRPEVVALGTMVGPAGARAVIRVASGRVVPAAPDECRFTTEEMLATERQVVEGCLERNAAARERAAEPRQVSPRVERGVWVVEPRPVTAAEVDEALRHARRCPPSSATWCAT